VSFSPAGATDWAQAPLNRPLVAGDRLWTDAGGRDEAQFGAAIARMDAGTLLTVLAADERTTQLQVSQGRIDLHVRRLAPGETVEVDTPNLAFVARQPGDYRLAVAPDGSTTDVTVLNGAGDVYGDGTSLALAPGQGYRFGGQDLNNYVLLPPAPPDDFSRWALARDQRYERAIARRYVPQGVVGAEDLDDYGSWRTMPEYGTVWVPDRAPRNWAPYHAGHWAWIDPWGWTWIDDQPYGYAVSHYGRWVRTPDTWAWVPAPPRAEPVYAPLRSGRRLVPARAARTVPAVVPCEPDLHHERQRDQYGDPPDGHRQQHHEHHLPEPQRARGGRRDAGAAVRAGRADGTRRHVAAAGRGPRRARAGGTAGTTAAAKPLRHGAGRPPAAGARAAARRRRARVAGARIRPRTRTGDRPPGCARRRPRTGAAARAAACHRQAGDAAAGAGTGAGGRSRCAPGRARRPGGDAAGGTTGACRHALAGSGRSTGPWPGRAGRP
jgi:hypothetical protein